MVCGSRSWREGMSETIHRRLDQLPDEVTLVHGDARGADRIAHLYALNRGWDTERFFPDYDRLGRNAPLQRNRAMLDTKPELVIAFWDGKSRGTVFVINEARRRGIPVEVVQSDVTKA